MRAFIALTSCGSWDTCLLFITISANVHTQVIFRAEAWCNISFETILLICLLFSLILIEKYDQILINWIMKPVSNYEWCKKIVHAKEKEKNIAWCDISSNSRIVKTKTWASSIISHDIVKSTSTAEHQVDLIEWIFVDINLFSRSNILYAHENCIA